MRIWISEHRATIAAVFAGAALMTALIVGVITRTSDREQAQEIALLARENCQGQNEIRQELIEVFELARALSLGSPATTRQQRDRILGFYSRVIAKLNPRACD
jgi:hypothetical protein